MKKNIYSFVVLIFVFLLSSIVIIAQDSHCPVYEEPILEPVLPYHISVLDLCDGKKDVYIKIDPTDGYNRITKAYTKVKTIFIAPHVENRGSFDPKDFSVMTDSFEIEMYGLTPSDGVLQFDVVALDESFNVMVMKTIHENISKSGSVKVSSRLKKYLDDWYRDDVPDDLFTYFCGKRISKVELLSFFQEFLDLTEQQICDMILRFEDISSSKWTGGVVILDWRDILCSVLDEWLADSTDTTGDECKCKVVLSKAAASHSNKEGGAEAKIGDSEAHNCPDIDHPFEDDLYWGDEAPVPNHLEFDQNWTNILWGFQGAASMMTMDIGCNYGEHWQPNAHVGAAGGLWSAITFTMYCYDPPFTSTKDCGCTKNVNVEFEYASNARGGSDSKNGGLFETYGSVSGTIEQNAYAVMTQYGTKGSDTKPKSTILDSGWARIKTSCLESSEANDTNSVFTQIGDIIVMITTAVKNASGKFTPEDIEKYFTGAQEIGDAVNNLIWESNACHNFIDTGYVLLQGSESCTLTSDYNNVTFSIISDVHAKAIVNEDYADLNLKVLSDFYLAGALLSDGDGESCCNDASGAYVIGNMSEFENDNLGEPKFDGLYQWGERPLSFDQRKVGMFYFGIDPQFLPLVFGYPEACQPQVDCYYECGYWAECEDSIPANPIILGIDNGFNIDYAKCFIYPNPTDGKVELFVTNVNREDFFGEIKIINLTGKLLMQFNNVEIADGKSISLNLTKLQSGTYFINLSSEKVNVTKKVIINK